jgi:hypothetical protein
MSGRDPGPSTDTRNVLPPFSFPFAVSITNATRRDVIAIDMMLWVRDWGRWRREERGRVPRREEREPIRRGVLEHEAPAGLPLRISNSEFMSEVLYDMGEGVRRFVTTE